MIADHYLVKKSFGPMIADEEMINGYVRFGHCVVCPPFHVRFWITSLVFSNLWSLCCLSFFSCTVLDYFFGIFKSLVIVLFVLLFMYGFLLLFCIFKSLVIVLVVLLFIFLLYFQTFDHCVVCPSVDVRLLITPLVFSNLWSLFCLSFC